MIFVNPTTDNTFPSDDPEVRGTVLLTLPSKRPIKAIRVVLEGICDANGGGGYPYETTTTLQKRLNLELGGEMLEAGDHVFNFSFIVPSSTAVFQRSTYGRVRHYVKAKVDFSSALSSTISSSPIMLWISATESSTHDIPEPLEINVEHFSEDLGPIAIGISSPHLTVSSLVAFRVAFVAPSQRATIQSISAFITQNFSIHYEDGSVAQPPPKRYQLTTIDETTAPRSLALPLNDDKPREPDPIPLKPLQPGAEWRFSRLARIPNDDHCRPTTLSGTQARIRVSHKISVEIKYIPAGGVNEKLITISKPVTVASCCCMIDQMYLPAYHRNPPKTVMRPLDSRCLCNLSLKELVDRDGFALEQAGSIETTEFHERLLGEERSDKSPGYSCTTGYT